MATPTMHSAPLSEQAKALTHKWLTHIKHSFTEHPAATEETYLQHLWFTVSMGGRLAFVAILLVFHGVLPFTFTKTASNQIAAIYRIMNARGKKKNPSDCAHDWCI